MASTGDPIDARQAEQALGTAHAAQAAARAAGSTRSRGHTLGQGLACAVGFTTLGLSGISSQWSGRLLTVGVLSLAAFLVLVWLGAHHGGTTPWFDRRREAGKRAWLLPLAPVAVGLVAAVPYGAPGWLIGFGLAGGVEYLLRATRTGTA
ncbi:hypothetical protein [Streptomyces sp. Ag109_G2-15]|uniref:hypothetical protein n=1 Tax=Streptomyces sp. Ag109_G2-15 TaxID=1938850 RepID=UPI000BC612C9|nr:hypothetical protein [Streptomyces sp. Ag109_G2-15]SOD85061.1 hypothetical protein SAMN06272765_2464 [Streptomyces sp. Ag109_G2-15]